MRWGGNLSVFLYNLFILILVTNIILVGFSFNWASLIHFHPIKLILRTEGTYSNEILNI